MATTQVQNRSRRRRFNILTAGVIIPISAVVGVTLGTTIVNVTKASVVSRSGRATHFPARVAADPSVCCCDDSACKKNCKTYPDGTCGERNKYPCNTKDCPQ